MLRTALTIAGLDPSGGAGIAADLRGFHAAGVWGAPVCACLTVQSTQGVKRVVAISSPIVLAQAREVLLDAQVGAIKIGALGSTSNLRAILDLLGEYARIPAVFDPVMAPSRAAAPRAWLNARRLEPLRALAARATLVTPNLHEAAAILGRPVDTDEDARFAAIALCEAGAHAALVKGGHGKGPEAVDFLAVGRRVTEIARPRRRVPPLHGTGCTISSLIAGRIAANGRGGKPSADRLIDAVIWAREVLDAALAKPLQVGQGLRVIDVEGVIRSRPSP